MTARHARFCATLFAVLVLASGLSSVSAQEATPEPEPVQLVDVTIGDALVISVPEGWLTWRREDFETPEAADLAAVELVRSLNIPDVAPNVPYIGDILQFMAMIPLEADGSLVQLRVETIGLTDFIGDADLEPESLDPSLVMEVTDMRVFNEVDVNEHPTSFGANPRLSIPVVTMIFVEDNLLAQLHLLAPGTWLDDQFDLAIITLLSLREQGQPIDLAAFRALTGYELPLTIMLPAETFLAESTAAPESTPDAVIEVTPEATSAAETPAASEVAVVACTITATTGANLRTGPGTTYNIEGTLETGDSGDADGQAMGTDGFVWWRLAAGGWARSDVVDETDDCDLLPVVTP